VTRTGRFFVLIFALITLCVPPHAAGAAPGLIIIRVGTESTFPPFVFRGSGGELAGFDIDLASEVLSRLGRKPRFVGAAFDALIPALVEGKIDMIAGGLSVTPERLERVDFSKVYFTSKDAVVTRANDTRPADMAALRGKTVAVQARTTQDDYLTIEGRVLLRRFQSSREALRAVLSGGADAAFMDAEVAKSFLSGDADFGRGLAVAFENSLSLGGMAFAFRKIDNSFVRDVNGVLDELVSEGYLEKLENKWFK